MEKISDAWDDRAIMRAFESAIRGHRTSETAKVDKYTLKYQYIYIIHHVSYAYTMCIVVFMNKQNIKSEI